MQETIHKTLVQGAEVFENLDKSEVLQARVARFGYDKARLDEGRTLLQQAQTAQRQFLGARSQQLAATDTFNAAWQEARNSYGHHRSAARRAFKQEREAQQVLHLSSDRKGDFRSWAGQVADFYGHLLGNPDYLTKMAVYDTDKVALQKGATLVTAAQTAKANQDMRRGQRRSAMRRCQTQMSKLRRWLNEFSRHARIALADSPQDLITLGLTRRRKRAAVADISAPVVVKEIWV